ncbi:MAG: methionine--tRNA ligase [Candidatus Paceibacterota bacterium]|jgi:methionyl-tRNA synthetase
MKKDFYLTTTLPYVNAEAHMGHAVEFVRADAVVRAKKLQGYEVFFNTGTDEHGQKIAAAAEKVGKDVQTYVDEYALKFKELLPLLGVSNDVHFIRTTDKNHELAAKEFWRRVDQNGFIYKKNYKSKYCVGCEQEKTDSELVDGKCPIHLNLEIEIIEEENYFFKFSEFGDKLLALYDEEKHRIIPEFRMNEVREFIKRGLQDFSISRLKSKMSWGIEVPGDSEHVMYVWFDALVNYLATLGWPEKTEDFEKFWTNGTPTQYCGKDNTRFQSVIWQAMLLAAKLPPTHTVVVNGFVTGDGGIKMSKSLGNVVNPVDIVKEYGTDALRYFLLRELSSFEDSPFTLDRFKDAYNANLANGIGNLTSRIMKMAETNLDAPVSIAEREDMSEYFSLFETYELNKVMDYVWEKIGELDRIIQAKEPFKLVKTDREAGIVIITDLVVRLYSIARMLNPLLTDTSDKIKAAVKANKMPTEPLFLRKD